MNAEVLYSVTWRDTPHGEPHTLDGYDKDEMHDVAIRLAGQGKDVLPLVGPIMVGQTPEDIEAMGRIKEKLMARLAADRAEQLVRERLARKVECQACRILFESTPTEDLIG